MKLSRNFTLEELVYSYTADKEGIDNTPSNEVIANLTTLVQMVLQPARDFAGRPITIGSGYRSDELNDSIGGAEDSQHTYGMAADIETEDLREIFNFIKDYLEFDQMIWEFGNEDQPDWIHVSYVESEMNRNQILVAYKDEDGRTAYKYWNE